MQNWSNLLVPSRPLKGSLLTSALQQQNTALRQINRTATEVDTAMVALVPQGSVHPIYIEHECIGFRSTSRGDYCDCKFFENILISYCKQNSLHSPPVRLPDVYFAITPSASIGIFRINSKHSSQLLLERVASSLRPERSIASNFERRTPHNADARGLTLVSIPASVTLDSPAPSNTFRAKENAWKEMVSIIWVVSASFSSLFCLILKAKPQNDLQFTSLGLHIIAYAITRVNTWSQVHVQRCVR